MAANLCSKISLSSPIVAIFGATGTGKSKLGIEIAKKFNGEVISVDSMQVTSLTSLKIVREMSVLFSDTCSMHAFNEKNNTFLKIKTLNLVPVSKTVKKAILNEGNYVIPIKYRNDVASKNWLLNLEQITW